LEFTVEFPRRKNSAPVSNCMSFDFICFARWRTQTNILSLFCHSWQPGNTQFTKTAEWLTRINVNQHWYKIDKLTVKSISHI